MERRAAADRPPVAADGGEAGAVGDAGEVEEHKNEEIQRHAVPRPDRRRRRRRRHQAREKQAAAALRGVLCGCEGECD